MSNPYKKINDFCYWSRAVSNPLLSHIDPVTKSKIIQPHEKLSTMGSCFSQHLSRHIKLSGLNYFVTENSEGLSEQDSIDRNFGIYTARYSNIYTIKQALQLFDRAFGYFIPIDKSWKREDGKYVDVFRPNIEPNGFETIEQLSSSLEYHLSCVRKMFIESDWLMFTMGLTEAWRSKEDGAIYPIAPGVVAGEYNPLLHEFVNFGVSEMKKDFISLVEKIKSVNPRLQILLTISPVPLIATYEPRHILVSNNYSKSALRVVADEMEREYDNIIYFPSFEIATSPTLSGRNYKDNLREMTQVVVNLVMQIFSKHFIANSIQNSLIINNETTTEVICDEETIEDAIKKSGF